MKLAIKYEERWKNEIIKFLSDIGGNDRLVSFQDGDYCYIDIEGQISSIKNWNARLKKDFCKFTYPELIEKFPYSPGDDVTLNELLRLGDERCDTGIIDNMFWDGQVQEIKYIVEFGTGRVNGDYRVSDLEPARKKVIDTPLNEFFVQSDKITAVNIQDQNYSEEVEIILNNSYELQERDGKWFAVKKKAIFPKTYGECSEIIDIKPERYLRAGNGKNTSELFFEEKIKQFRKLIICRNAYWKLLSDWKPNSTTLVSSISRNNDKVEKYDEIHTGNVCILEFPTQESRDVFFENFKDLIEDCKEFI